MFQASPTASARQSAAVLPREVAPATTAMPTLKPSIPGER